MIVTRPVQPAPVSAPLSTDHSADRIPRACNVMQGAIGRIDTEGAGDALFCGETLYGGYLIRSDALGLQWLGERMGCRVIPLQLVDDRILHVDA